jgi:hypothetical protein
MTPGWRRGAWGSDHTIMRPMALAYIRTLYGIPGLLATAAVMAMLSLSLGLASAVVSAIVVCVEWTEGQGLPRLGRGSRAPHGSHHCAEYAPVHGTLLVWDVRI